MPHYLLFHSLAEIGAATICFGTFLFAWNTRRYQNGFFQVLGATALFVTLFGLLHCLAFPGMNLFPEYDENLSPQLWLGARSFEAAGLVAGLLLVDRSMPSGWLLAGAGAVFAAVTAAIFGRLLPSTVLPVGLTSFKIAMEWSIAGAFLLSIALVRRVRTRFSPRIYRLLVLNSATMAACEICFTLYTRPDDVVNLVGHLFLVTGVWLQYQAFLRVGLVEPNEAQFHGLAQAQEALRRSEALYRAIPRSIPGAAVMVVDGAQRLLVAEGGLLATLGLEGRGLEHRPLTEAVPDPELRTGMEEGFRGALDGASSEREDAVAGRAVWSRYVPLRDERGATLGGMHVALDVTDLRHAERELQRARDRLERAQAAGRVGTVEWDVQQGRMALTGMDTVYGDPSIGEVGSYDDWRRRLPPEDAEGVERRLANVLARESAFEFEHRAIWPDGTVHWVQSRGHVERDAAGRAVRLVGVNVDVTEQKRAEQALRDADRRKSEFLAVLSHELRNPLAPIHNGLYVLERAPEGSPQARRALSVIRRQATQLGRLVDDLLDVTRISRGKIRLQRRPMELVEVTRRTAEDHRDALAANGVTFEARTARPPLWIDGDATRVAQIIGNLLGNAAKFTPRGGRVSLSLEAEGAQAVLRVQDDGVGIDPSMLPHLFEPFMQADQTLDRSRGGLGLGLALVKSLVDLHGGSVRASSAGPGKGAAFEIRLPLAEESTRPAPTPAAPAPRRKVLVIEDNPDAGDTLREALLFKGHEVHVARCGADGIEAAARLRPDVILCDVGLPDLDGYEVARRLREETGCAAFLVALTGYASAEDRARSSAAGFDRHVAKPVDLDLLDVVLAQAEPAPADCPRA